MTIKELEERLSAAYFYPVEILEIEGNAALVRTPKYRRCWMPTSCYLRGETL